MRCPWIPSRRTHGVRCLCGLRPMDGQRIGSRWSDLAGCCRLQETRIRSCGCRLMRKSSRTVDFWQASFPPESFPVTEGKACGAVVACPGLEGGGLRAAVCRHAMICKHCRVPNACSSVTTNPNFLHNRFFLLRLHGASARRFAGAACARAGATNVRRITAKQEELRELDES